MQDELGRAVLLTLVDPRGGARLVLGWRLGWAEVGLVFATGLSLTLLISAILGEVVQAPAPAGGEAGIASDLAVLSPLRIIGHAAIAAVLWALVLWIGRGFGGAGDGLAVAAAIAWVEVIQAALNLGLVVATILPGPAFVVAQVGLALWGLWILACFVAEAHGFRSPGRVLAALLAIGFGLSVGLVLLLMAAGVVPPGAPP